ncbi:MAG: hypothetical protein JWQ81_6344 [Amycolatopsis sp.]|nr:hypothetical protein [Amycolatopsis sp.]
MSSKNFLKRAGFVSMAVAATGLLGAGVASAHVTANVYGSQPTKGGYAAIFFRVPNEDANLGTIGLEVDFKPEYGIGGVRTKPVPGWTAVVTTSDLPAPVKTASGTEVTKAVTKVVWTAQPGNKIAAGSSEFQEFEVSAGPLPNNVDELVFPTIQTYEGGKVVDWTQLSTPGAAEPEHPAPTVQLAAQVSGDGDSPAMNMGGTTTTEAAAPSGSDNTARWLGGAGLVVGALGLGVGAGATLRARKAGAAGSNRTEGTE